MRTTSLTALVRETKPGEVFVSTKDMREVSAEYQRQEAAACSRGAFLVMQDTGECFKVCVTEILQTGIVTRYKKAYQKRQESKSVAKWKARAAMWKARANNSPKARS